MELIRCPACRGTKKLAGLGGVLGDCKTCAASGKIQACDKPVQVCTVLDDQCEVIQAVALATVEPGPVCADSEVACDVKVTRKRAVYKRKTSGE